MKTLSSLQIGDIATIQSIGEGLSVAQKRRLLDLGFYPGAKVRPAFKSAMGEPKAFEILGSIVALRKEQTDFIFTSTKEDNN